MTKYCYIHVPFCESICSYCDFCKLFYNESLVDKYLIALEKEIESIYQNDYLDTIYIGGGTPSALNLKQLERLFKILDRLKKNKDIEYTIEGNFESTTLDKLKLYKKYGINRLSFGIESISPKNLKFLDRKTNMKEVETIINTAKKLGFNNINLDLMYAFPNETKKELEKDIDYLLSLNVEHISTYSLIIEEHTKLYLQKIKNIEQDLDAEMYEIICKRLKQNNYYHYEISNFCKENYYSRHNNCYWNNEEYYGFGLGASSYLNNQRITNTRSINKYLTGIYKYYSENIDMKLKIEYEIILNLRKKTGISLSMFQKKYHKKFSELYNYKRLLSEGLLQEAENSLFIPEDKWYISNEIITRLLGCEING